MTVARPARSPQSFRSLSARISKRLWGERRPVTPLVLIALGVALFMATPLIYIFVRAAGSGSDVWSRLASTRLPELFANTLGLTLVCTVATIAIGVSLAWIVERTDIPGRKAWRWVLAMPLAIPPYVGGLVYITIFGPRGILEEQVTKIWGAAATAALPDFLGFAGAAVVLTLFTYPYVYLVTSASLRSFNTSLEDAGRTLGYSPAQVFRKVTLPLIRPGIGAGALLVALYVLSDFGAVALMRFDTFTLAIYQELTTRFSREGAAVLSAILVFITFIFLWGEARFQGRARYYQTVGTWRPVRPHALGKTKGIALGYIFFIFSLTLVIPLALLIYWAAIGVQEQRISIQFLGYMLNSFGLSIGAATLGVLIAIPVAFLAVRHPGPVSTTLSRFAQAGYALPGVVVALSVVFLFTRFAPLLYGTLAALVAAYLIRFLPQTLRSSQSGLTQISPNLEDAARNLGRTPGRTLREVTIPLILPSLIAGWTLVFLSVMKELPATLLLRPVDFDTLPVRLWVDASEGFYSLASIPALVLVLVSIVPLYLLLTRTKEGLSGTP